MNQSMFPDIRTNNMFGATVNNRKLNFSTLSYHKDNINR